jgi:hypothetical protein
MIKWMIIPTAIHDIKFLLEKVKTYPDLFGRGLVRVATSSYLYTWKNSVVQAERYTPTRKPVEKLRMVVIN